MAGGLTEAPKGRVQTLGLKYFGRLPTPRHLSMLRSGPAFRELGPLPFSELGKNAPTVQLGRFTKRLATLWSGAGRATTAQKTGAVAKQYR